MQAYQDKMVSMQAKGRPPAVPCQAPPAAEEIPFLLREQPPTDDGPTAGEGSLQVRAFTAEGALPVADALVRVYLHRGESDTLQYAVTTDADGLSPLLLLPAQDAARTQQPGAPAPLEDIWVLVEKAGYYSQRHEHIVLYAGVRSRQPVALVPLPDGVSEAPVQVFESQRPNL